MQPLFDGVFLLEGEAGGRPLQLIYLRGVGQLDKLRAGCLPALLAGLQPAAG
jgi:hypothetical protein